MEMEAALQAPASARWTFNPFDPAFRADPHPTYDRLRAEKPYLRTLGTVVLTQYDPVMEVLKSRNFSVALIPATISEQLAKLGFRDIELVERLVRKLIVFTDNPDHARLRRLVNQAYTPAGIEELSRRIEREVERLIDGLAPAGTMDLVQDVAAPLPLNVLCDWMGVPPSDRTYMRPRIHAARMLLDPGLMTRSDFRGVLAAVHDLSEYFSERVAAAAKSEEDTLVARLLRARSDDDRLTDEEVAFACIMSFVAGNETTQSLIGNTVNTLLKYPDQLRRVQRDRSLITPAVEETLRFEPPVQMTKREALTTVDLGDCRLDEGDQVLLCLAAANRDPGRFSNPHRYDISRDGPAHVGFGYGMHACLGGLLARRQAEIVLDALVSRFAAIERADGVEAWQTHSLILRGLDTLPIRFSLQ
jgi:cytochrome P450